MTRLSASLLVALSLVDVPFNGENLEGWEFRGSAERSRWVVGRATLDPQDAGKLKVEAGDQLVNAAGGGVDLFTSAEWGDALYELEFMVPKGSNSGVYLLGEYEVQILDSFGKEKVGAGDAGGLYGAAAPRVNASLRPGEWQTLAIDFRAPRFGADGKKLEDGDATFVKVELNGRLIHENVRMKGPTPGGLKGRDVSRGPLLLQGDHGPAAFRNLRVTGRER